MSILKRLPGSRCSQVERAWEGATVVLIGGGPSLSTHDVAQVAVAYAREVVKCVVINDAYLLAPFADLLYFADSHWWKWQTSGIPKPSLGLSAEQVKALFADFKGTRCTIKNTGANVTDESIHMLLNVHGTAHGTGLSSDPCALATGRHSGFQALNLAVLAGATRVLLLGFDGRADKAGKTHWFGEHPRPTNPAIYAQIKQSFSMAEKDLKALGVEVINCSPGSAIDSFEKMPLGEALMRHVG